MLSDLHVHTSASDGTLSPAQVVELALALNLAAIGITDHDTISGVGPALEAAALTPLAIVPGVELSTEYGGAEIHILGYYIDTQCRVLHDTLSFFREKRMERAVKMVERLQQLGYAIDMDRVLSLAGPGAVGRPHIGRALVEAGYVKDVSDAFAKLIGPGCPAYFPRYKYTPQKAVRLINSAGGCAVLAHPGLTPEQAEEILPQLVAGGLGGLEVYHYAHDRALTQKYLELSRTFGLIATGGSDFHGKGHKDRCELGSHTVPTTCVKELFEFCCRKKK